MEERTPNRRARRTSTFLMRMAAKGRRVHERPQAQEEARVRSTSKPCRNRSSLWGALKPKGQLTLKLEEEWRAALRRRVLSALGDRGHRMI